jgi:energy-coupling factor transport system permease protein
MPILLYAPGNTILHKMNPLTKLIMIFSIWLTALISFDIMTFSIMLSILVVFWILGKISLKEIASFVKLLSIVFSVFIVINGFMYFRGKTPLFYILGFPFTIEGLLFGITLCLKVVCIVSTIPLLTKTTMITDLISALVKLRIPYSLVFIFITAINFIDVIEETYNNIKESQILRGYSIDEMNFLKKAIKGYAPLFIPLVLIILRKASMMDMAMESRAFNATKKRTYVNEIKFTKIDIATIILFVIVSSILIFYNVIYGKVTLILPT